MNIIENVKTYFSKKLKNEKGDVAPKGVCPNCWGKQEWDGEFYKKIKAKNITPESNTYTSFINEVVTKLDKITLKDDTYKCETCKINFES
jgi:hypothetical protein